MKPRTTPSCHTMLEAHAPIVRTRRSTGDGPSVRVFHAYAPNRRASNALNAELGLVLLCHKHLGRWFRFTPDSEGPVDRSAEGAGDETRLASYLEHLASSLGHADRRAPFGSYCKGLILPGERKSVEPIAARVEPRRVQGAHQSLHHFVANADWSQEALLRRVRTFFCLRSKRAAESELGSSTTRDSRRRAFIPLASPGSIAGNSASRTIVRLRCRCR